MPHLSEHVSVASAEEGLGHGEMMSVPLEPVSLVLNVMQ